VVQACSPGSCSVKCWGDAAAIGAAVEIGVEAASVAGAVADSVDSAEAARVAEELPAVGDTTLVTTWTS